MEYLINKGVSCLEEYHSYTGRYEQSEKNHNMGADLYPRI